VVMLLTALATGGNDARIARFIEADDQC
jgi:hypothetical protein